jgi:hypothetical protein
LRSDDNTEHFALKIEFGSSKVSSVTLIRNSIPILDTPFGTMSRLHPSLYAALDAAKAARASALADYYRSEDIASDLVNCAAINAAEAAVDAAQDAIDAAKKAADAYIAKVTAELNHDAAIAVAQATTYVDASITADGGIPTLNIILF